MPSPLKKVNGAEANLEKLRQECTTQFLNDPASLKRFRANARAEAKKSLLERKIVTESEIAEIEAELAEEE